MSVSYTHLDVYKRQLYTRVKDGRLYRYYGKTGGILSAVQAATGFEGMRLLA